MLANPKPSAHTISPSTPTATDMPGTFSLESVVRTTPRPCSTAAAHLAEGGAFVTDAMCSGSGFTLVAVSRWYSTRLGTPTTSTPRPERQNSSHLGIRRFDISDQPSWLSFALQSKLGSCLPNPDHRR